MASLPIHRYTPEEYLEIERKAEFKSEYYAGEMFAMAGGSPAHATISINLASELRFLFRGRPCQPFNGDVRVQISDGASYAYPDVSVVCGEQQFSDKHKDTLLNPSVIVEVLSPSTEAYDRGLKFELYCLIEGLQEYVLVSQDKMRIELFERQGDGSWRMTAMKKPEDFLHLPSVDARIRLADIYEKVEFTPRPPQIRERNP